MRDFSNLFLGLVLATAVAFPVSITDAASVTILPLINNSLYENANVIFQQNAIVAMERTGDFHLVENDSIIAVIDKECEDGILPTQKQMQNIVAQSGVDVVIAMQLDKLDKKTTRGKYQDFMELVVSGKLVCYNALTGKFYEKSLYSGRKVNPSEYSRSNFKDLEFARITRNTVGKALGNERIQVDRPRIGW